ncbi:hypothetical protein [Rathayibacter sp. AY1A7]|jgi:hypothetical protein|uniref:hypothetical protein n=1 Tax=Rathayibacter sp. AY1A7 TaxID=2080524 RepID=UPI0011B0C384|nr:hypothetical protein [Rathayibacter sp. AY1A7]
MTTSNSATVHFLLLTIDVWTAVPTVIGIFDTEAGAINAARAATQNSGSGPDRFALEEWRGTARWSSTTLSDPHAPETLLP